MSETSLGRFLETMDVSIIISYYKALPELKIILAALGRQSDNSFEVIISEDDDNPETRAFVNESAASYAFAIVHLHQDEDVGFRKNMMLNRSVVKAQGELLLFIDGDCIPHTHFVKEYKRAIEAGHYYSGRRVMLGQKLSAEILQTREVQKLGLFSVIFSDSDKRKEAIYSPHFHLSLKTGTRGLLGCNWGVLKKDLLAVNGFDEEYISPGVGEDNDVDWRLEQNGLTKKSVKNKAIVFHLHHPRSYGQAGVMDNFKLFERKKEQRHIKCLNGIQTLDESN